VTEAEPSTRSVQQIFYDQISGLSPVLQKPQLKRSAHSEPESAYRIKEIRALRVVKRVR
jgi:hypothetical protein